MVFTRVLIVLFLFSSYFTFAQEDVSELILVPSRPKKEVEREMSFMKVEHGPIFPGCEKEKSKIGKKKCLQHSISRHVSENFDMDLGNTLGLHPGKKRILVQFKIDKRGDVINIMIKAPHPRLKREAIRVIKKLPKMMPGKHSGEPVIVIYRLPIQFSVD